MASVGRFREHARLQVIAAEQRAATVEMERDVAWAECAELRAAPPSPALDPAESVALTVGLAQVMRGEHSNVAAVCILALNRIARGTR